MSALEQMHGNANEPERQRTIGNLDPDKMSTNQRKVIPHGRGRKVCPALWIGQIENQYTEPAPVERPGKK